MCRFVLLLAGWLALASTAVSQDAPSHWAHWRGPSTTGVAAEGAHPPINFSEQQNLRWKVPIPGEGNSTPVIWGEKLFLLTARESKRDEAAEKPARNGTSPVSFIQPEDRRRGGRRFGRRRNNEPQTAYEFVVLCLDRHSGKTLWEKVARADVPHEGRHRTNTFASASPVTDGKHLYASFGSRGIYCYTLDGELVWDVDLGDMETRGGFGEGATPALSGQTLVIPWDHEGESFVVALDAKTGDEIWRAQRDEPTTWATPLVVPRGDRKQVILNGTNRVHSYDLATGDELWECGGQAMNPIPTPVADEQNTYVMTGFRGYALYAIPLDASGDLTDTDKIAWSLDAGTPYISSPVLHEGLLYVTKGRNAILSCIDAETGEFVYTNKRLPGLDTLYASPVMAGGHLYIFSREGACAVVKAGREYEVVAENQLDEAVDASPAVIGDVMYVRGENSLYCLAKEE